MGGKHEKASGAMTGLEMDLKAVREIYAREAYMLCYDVITSTVMIVLEARATPADQLKAWCQALVLVRSLDIKIRAGGNYEDERVPGDSVSAALLKQTLEQVDGQWKRHMQAMRDAGWDLRIAALETQSGKRMCIVERAENES